MSGVPKVRIGNPYPKNPAAMGDHTLPKQQPHSAPVDAYIPGRPVQVLPQKVFSNLEVDLAVVAEHGPNFFLEAPLEILRYTGAESVTLIMMNPDGLLFRTTGTTSKSMPIDRVGTIQDLRALESRPNCLVEVRGSKGELVGYVLIGSNSQNVLASINKEELGKTVQRQIVAANEFARIRQSSLGGGIINLSAFGDFLGQRLALSDVDGLIILPKLKPVNAGPGGKLSGNAYIVALGDATQRYFAERGINVQVKPQLGKDGVALWIVFPKGTDPSIIERGGARLDTYLEQIKEVDFVPDPKKPEIIKVKIEKPEIKTRVIRIRQGTDGNTALTALDNATLELDMAGGSINGVQEASNYLGSEALRSAEGWARERNWSNRLEIENWMIDNLAAEWKQRLPGISDDEAHYYAAREYELGGYRDTQSWLPTHEVYLRYAAHLSSQGETIVIVAWDGKRFGAFRKTFPRNGAQMQSTIVRDRIPYAAMRLNEELRYEAIKLEARYGENSDEFFWVLQIDDPNPGKIKVLLERFNVILNTPSPTEAPTIAPRKAIEDYLGSLNQLSLMQKTDMLIPEERVVLGLKPGEEFARDLTIGDLIKLGWIKEASTGSYEIDKTLAPRMNDGYVYTVAEEMTLEALARKLGIPEGSIRTFEIESGFKRGDVLKPGSKIRVAGAFVENGYVQGNKANRVVKVFDAYRGVEMGYSFEIIPPNTNIDQIEAISNKLEDQITRKKQDERGQKRKEIADPEYGGPERRKSGTIEPQLRAQSASKILARAKTEEANRPKYRVNLLPSGKVDIIPNSNGSQKVTITRSHWDSLVKLGAGYGLTPEQVSRAAYLSTNNRPEIQSRLKEQFNPKNINAWLQTPKGKEFLVRNKDTLQTRMLEGGPSLLIGVIALLGADEIADIIGINGQTNPVGRFAFVLGTTHLFNMAAGKPIQTLTQAVLYRGSGANSVAIAQEGENLVVNVKNLQGRQLLTEMFNYGFGGKGILELAKGTVKFPVKMLEGMGPGLFTSAVVTTLANAFGMQPGTATNALSFGAFFMPDVINIALPRVAAKAGGRLAIGLTAGGQVLKKFLGAAGAPFALGMGLDLWTMLWEGGYDRYVDQRAMQEDGANMINSGGRLGYVGAFMHSFASTYAPTAMASLNCTQGSKDKIMGEDRRLSLQYQQAVREYLKVNLLTMYKDADNIDFSFMMHDVEFSGVEKDIYKLYAVNIDLYSQPGWTPERISEDMRRKGLTNVQVWGHREENAPEAVQRTMQKIQQKQMQEAVKFLVFVNLDCNDGIRQLFDNKGHSIPGRESDLIRYVFALGGAKAGRDPKQMLINTRKLIQLKTAN